jgi:antitoxin FitA
MGQMLIRNLDDGVIARLKARAALHQTSAEEEARRALSASVGGDREAILAKARAIREANGPQVGPSSLELLREDRARDDEA